MATVKARWLLTFVAAAVWVCLHAGVASAHGSELATFVGGSSDSDGVFILHPHGGRLRQIAERVPYFVDDYSTRVAWSPDRSMLAFEAGREYAENIYVWSRRTDRVRQITDQRGREVHPSWSPSGERLVYLRESYDVQSDLWIVRADGSGRHRLTDNRAPEETPEWSPDGSKIVYQAGDGLVAVRPDGSGRRRLTNSSWDTNPAWAPGSNRLVFTHVVTGGGGAFLKKVDANGSNLERLTEVRGASRDEQPEWSPDGTRILFVRSASRGTFLYTVRPGGRGLKRLAGKVSDEEFVGDAEWGRGSKLIAYRRYHREADERQREVNIWLMRRDGSNKRNATPDGGPGSFFGLDW